MSNLDNKPSFWSFLLIIQALILCILVNKPEATKRPFIDIKSESVSIYQDTIKQDGTLINNTLKL